MIIEDLDDFMKRNGIDTDTKEHSSKEKIGRLQGRFLHRSMTNINLRTSQNQKGHKRINHQRE